MTMATKVLVADDEQDIKDVVQMFLENQGYEVETAYDGLDAMDRVNTWKPDVVLLDIMMPLMDGIAVCKKIKSDPATRSIKVIMVSAASKREKEGEAYQAGADGYVLKPFDPADLSKVIEQTMGAKA